MPPEKVLGQFPLDNCPPGNYHPGQLSPDNSHLGKFPPVNSPGQFPHRTTALPADHYTPAITAQSNGNYKLRFCHGYFLVPFHCPII